MDMVKCIGAMEVSIKDNGEMEFSMDQDRFMFLAKDIRKEYLRIMY